ncbi:MAG: hypothetical protein Q9197_003299 [Variospora fuerteventurae]
MPNSGSKAIKRQYRIEQGWLADPNDEYKELFEPGTERFKHIKAKIDRGPPFSPYHRKDQKAKSKRSWKSTVTQQTTPADPLVWQQELERREQDRKDQQVRNEHELALKRWEYDAEISRQKLEMYRLQIGGSMMSSLMSGAPEDKKLLMGSACDLVCKDTRTLQQRPSPLAVTPKHGSDLVFDRRAISVPLSQRACPASPAPHGNSLCASRVASGAASNHMAQVSSPSAPKACENLEAPSPLAATPEHGSDLVFDRRAISVPLSQRACPASPAPYGNSLCASRVASDATSNHMAHVSSPSTPKACETLEAREALPEQVHDQENIQEEYQDFHRTNKKPSRAKDSTSTGSKWFRSYVQSIKGKKLDLGGIIITEETFSILEHACFGTQTFDLLCAMTRIPQTWIVYISGGRTDILRRNPHVSHVGFICLAPGSTSGAIGHWFLIHVGLVDKTLELYDALHNPRSPILQLHLEAYKKVVNMLEGAGLIHDPAAWASKHMVPKLDSTSCGPLTWRELEILMGLSVPLDEDPRSLRIRLCTQLATVASEMAEVYNAASVVELEVLHETTTATIPKPTSPSSTLSVIEVDTLESHTSSPRPRAYNVVGRRAPGHGYDTHVKLQSMADKGLQVLGSPYQTPASPSLRRKRDDNDARRMQPKKVCNDLQLHNSSSGDDNGARSDVLERDWPLPTSSPLFVNIKTPPEPAVCQSATDNIRQRDHTTTRGQLGHTGSSTDYSIEASAVPGEGLKEACAYNQSFQRDSLDVYTESTHIVSPNPTFQRNDVHGQDYSGWDGVPMTDTQMAPSSILEGRMLDTRRTSTPVNPNNPGSHGRDSSDGTMPCEAFSAPLIDPALFDLNMVNGDPDSIQKPDEYAPAEESNASTAHSLDHHESRLLRGTGPQSRKISNKFQGNDISGEPQNLSPQSEADSPAIGLASIISTTGYSEIWSKQEIDLLRLECPRFTGSWRRFTLAYFPQRTIHAVIQKVKKLRIPSVKTAVRKSLWTGEELQLAAACMVNGEYLARNGRKDWKDMLSTYLPYRTVRAIQLKCLEIQEGRSTRFEDNWRWTEARDESLLRLADVSGSPDWEQLAREIGYATAESVKLRHLVLQTRFPKRKIVVDPPEHDARFNDPLFVDIGLPVLFSDEDRSLIHGTFGSATQTKAPLLYHLDPSVQNKQTETILSNRPGKMADHPVRPLSSPILLSGYLLVSMRFSGCITHTRLKGILARAQQMVNAFLYARKDFHPKCIQILLRVHRRSYWLINRDIQPTIPSELEWVKSAFAECQYGERMVIVTATADCFITNPRSFVHFFEEMGAPECIELAMPESATKTSNSKRWAIYPCDKIIQIIREIDTLRVPPKNHTTRSIMELLRRWVKLNESKISKLMVTGCPKAQVETRGRNSTVLPEGSDSTDDQSISDDASDALSEDINDARSDEDKAIKEPFETSQIYCKVLNCRQVFTTPTELFSHIVHQHSDLRTTQATMVGSTSDILSASDNINKVAQPDYPFLRLAAQQGSAEEGHLEDSAAEG